MSTSRGYAEERVAVRPAPLVSTKNALAGGAAAGIAGGILMAMVAMLRAWSTGMGFFLPVKNIAAAFLGVEALVGGAVAVMVGLLIHIVTSAVWGGIFGIAGGARTTKGRALLFGMMWGVLVWGIMTHLALPVVNEVMRERVAMQPIWFFGFHLVFGAMLFLAPAIARSLEHPSARASAR